MADSIPSSDTNSTTTPAGQVAALIKIATLDYLESLGADGAEVKASILGADVELQLPRDPRNGDWATNVAMRLAKPLKLPPLAIAEAIRDRIPVNDLIEPPEVAKPGFINLRVAPGALRQIVGRIFGEGKRYGQSEQHSGERVLVEFVSANPTGPLHVGHGRNAVVGDTLARIYAAVGYHVEKEYYFNDAGAQMDLLGKSVRARYLEACGSDPNFPEDGYHGDYVREIAQRLFAEVGPTKIADDNIAFYTEYGSRPIIASIREVLDKLGIQFDHYFSESSLHRDGRVQVTLDHLQKLGALYEKDGALWLKSSAYGDDEDRVVRKSDGTLTYLSPDIAYHEDKLQRGFKMLVNVLGADHHSYIVRLRAAIEALGYDATRLHTVLIQMVTVKKGGEVCKLGKRAGGYVTLAEIVDELGRDITRFFYLLRTADSQMTFDVDLAKETSKDNPYWYIQYVHARCCSLLGKAEEKGAAWGGFAPEHSDLLAAPEERAILFQLGRLPAVVMESAGRDEPLPIINYLREVAAGFHAYYSAGDKDDELRVVQIANPALTQARLTLIVALRTVIANGLRLLGLTPIDRL